ncbi:MAG: capsule assembly Wzi family protein [Bacteroidota bacterium]
MRRTGLVLITLWVAASAGAQPEIVPAEHRVYDWLSDQRVAGVLPEFDSGTRPQDRLAIRRHLDSLSVRADRLGASGRYWLSEFRREFFEPLDRVHSYVGDGTAAWASRDAERTWLYSRDDDWRAVVWGEGALEVRSSEQEPTASGVSRSARLTFEASWRDRIGLYTSTINGAQFTGDTRVLLADPLLAPLYFVSRDSSNVQGPFDQSTAVVRGIAGPFWAEIANARLTVGTSADDPLAVSDNADYLPFVRLGLRTRSVRVQAIHAALSSRSRTVLDENGNEAFFDSPERFMAMHRLDVQPAGWISAAFTEAVIYGRRGPELAYLNPLFPVEAAEHALWDRDNAFFTLETSVRPIRGVELYGTWLVDDLATATLGDASYGNKWAIQAGAQITVPRTGVTGFAEYTRIEPYTYTHRFQENGIFFNSVTQNGFGIGHPLGPNADQWLAGVNLWLPFRARGRIAGRYVRKGRNPVDPETGATINIGGDIRNGSRPADDRKVFLAGDVFRGPGIETDVEIEPIRGVALRGYGNIQMWDDRATRVFVRFGLAVRP